MEITRDETLGESIFKDLEKNGYLNQLFKDLLYNYSIAFFKLPLEEQKVSESDLLRFADLLSKSCFTDKQDFHKNIAQTIIVLLNNLGHNDEKNIAYASNILKTLGNYAGLKIIYSNYMSNTFNDSIIEKAYSKAKMDALKMNDEDDKYYFQIQKNILSSMNENLLSYSGPTSMGKSMIMKKFIGNNIIKNSHKNYAIIIPSKALINEVNSDFIKNLEKELKLNDYVVVTSAGALALEKKSNFLFIMTPERLLYLMIKYPNIPIDSIFIDEAHKISSDDDRSTFYYKIIEMSYNKNPNTRYIFASPNIPNPEIYTKIVTNLIETNQKSINFSPTIIQSAYSPVVHIQYYVDFVDKTIYVYNELKNNFEFLTSMNDFNSPFIGIDMFDFFKKYGGYYDGKQTLIYCNSKDKAINYAIRYSKNTIDLKDAELEDFAKIIERDINKDYLLPDLIRHGIAYHIGYLPAYIRDGIEKLYKTKKIKVIFSTSTLIEGVNLPADSLFVLNYKRGLGTMTPVEFKNMLGRVGRLGINIYGNTFIFREDPNLEQDEFFNLVTKPVEEQVLSIDDELTGPQKESVVDSLCLGNTLFPLHPKKQSEKSYSLMRKFGLILLKDIKQNKSSIVFKAFEKQLLEVCNNNEILLKLYSTIDIKKTKLEVIKKRLYQESLTVDDDINTSHDQKQKLKQELEKNLSYPPLRDTDNGKQVNYYDLLDFLKTLSVIFNWSFYERQTLGAKDKNTGEYKYLAWYATILTQWMNGAGLNRIVADGLKNKKEKDNSLIKIYGMPTKYDYTNRLHRNIAIGEILDVIDKIVLFKISNYFLRFSTEYKAHHNIDDEMDNDWYEYVEYGSINPLNIFLQRNGFKRETAQFIKDNPRYYIEHPFLKYQIKNSIFNDKNLDYYVKDDLDTVKINIPEIFTD